MKVNYQLTNVVGTVYKGGQLAFLGDGRTLVSPVGNAVRLLHLEDRRSETVQLTVRKNIVVTAVSPRGNLLLLVDESGEAVVVSLVSRTVLHRHRFNRPVHDALFTPDGSKFLVCRDTDVQVFRSPGAGALYNPFVLLRTLKASAVAASALSCSADSALAAVACEDMKTIVFGPRPMRNLFAYSVGGHTGPVVGAFFLPASYDLITVGARGFVLHWNANLQPGELEPLEERREEADEEDAVKAEPAEKMVYAKEARHSLHSLFEGPGVKVTTAAFSANTMLLVTGYSNGAFALHEMPAFSLVQSLSVGNGPVGGICVSGSGDWVGLGLSGSGEAGAEGGQLVVWEWASESFVVREAGHLSDTSVVAYSPDGWLIATGGADGKVKVWDSRSGFCKATFSEHKGGIRGLAWTQGGKAVVSASLDGSVRAFDLKRLRNFKTLTSPAPVQFSCLAVDGSGEVVAAGAEDVFQIFLWSLGNGRLLEVLSGHEGPVSSVAFNGTGNQLLSTSWDASFRVWEVFEGKSRGETVGVSAEALCGAFSPDGRTAAVLDLNSVLRFYDWRSGEEVGSIECAADLDPGRAREDEVTAQTSGKAKSFTSFVYSPDGEAVVVGGQSAFVGLYSVAAQVLLRKWPLSSNYSLRGVARTFDPHQMSEFGLLPAEEKLKSGSKVAPPAPRSFRVSGLAFSPAGRSFAAASPEGVCVFSLDAAAAFDPFQLGREATPAAVRSRLAKGDFPAALLLALRLNDHRLVAAVLHKVPAESLATLCGGLPLVYAEKLLAWLAAPETLDRTPHLHFHLKLLRCLLSAQGAGLKGRAGELMGLLTGLERSVAQRTEALRRLSQGNRHSLAYLRGLHEARGDAPKAMEA